ncbi:hypothetical protein GQ607_014137 [Colletotrichum asianum]|uniref:Uncharacterized protein n=1 Tax=Colletotrichum asianum TaxID=702518 RepID=A0A8H3VXX3_9PEZI|nr:hypothetical protein GQ607_014137 [Colletotrichum asianum]
MFGQTHGIFGGSRESANGRHTLEAPCPLGLKFGPNHALQSRAASNYIANITGQVAMQHSPYQPTWPHLDQPAAVRTICVLGLIESAIVLEVYVHCRHTVVCTACRHVVRTNQREKRHREKEILYFFATNTDASPSSNRPLAPSRTPRCHHSMLIRLLCGAQCSGSARPDAESSGDRQRADQQLNLVLPPVFWRPPFSTYLTVGYIVL